jgi:hypothetical protein
MYIISLVYENLTPETTVRLLENWKNGKPNKVGPQVSHTHMSFMSCHVCWPAHKT